MATATSTQWFLASNGSSVGPFTSAQLCKMGDEGRIHDAMVIRRGDKADWQPVGKVRGLRVVPKDFVPATQPTERQRQYAEHLGIVVKPGMTRDQLSGEMSAVLGRDFKTGRFVKQRVVGHVTTEATSKTLKALWLVSWLMFIGGLAAVMLSLDTRNHEPGAVQMLGSVAFVLSIPFGIGLRIAKWWNHG